MGGFSQIYVCDRGSEAVLSDTCECPPPHRYIQEVLQMYDDNDTTEDDYSDSSVEDNPERNNLFDRLSRPV